MPRLILLMALALAGYIIYLKLKSLPPSQRKSALVKIGLGALVIIVVVATMTGRMHWLGAAITGLLVGISRLLPTLVRVFPMLQWLQRQRGGSGAGQQSQVETAIIVFEDSWHV